MKKWKYRTTDNEVLGMGYLPNGFAENELNPTFPDVVEETIFDSCNPNIDEDTLIIRTGPSAYTETPR